MPAITKGRHIEEYNNKKQFLKLKDYNKNNKQKKIRIPSAAPCMALIAPVNSNPNEASNSPN